MSQDTTVTRRRRSPLSAVVGRVLGWVAVNLILGHLAVVPVMTAVVLGSYVRAKVWGTVAAPFDAEEATVAAAVVVVIGGVLAVGTVLANRAVHRRGGVPRRAPAFWFATAVLQLLPSLVFLLATDRTVYGLFGRGLFW